MSPRFARAIAPACMIAGLVGCALSGPARFEGGGDVLGAPAAPPVGGHEVLPPDAPSPFPLDAPDAAEEARLLGILRAFEDSCRAAADFAHLVPGNRAHGPDPFALAALPGGGIAGVLRGADTVVLLDRNLREVQRVDAPPEPTSLAVSEGALLVSGALTGRIARYEIRSDGRLGPPRWIDLPLTSARSLAVLPDGAIAVADGVDDRLLALRLIRPVLDEPPFTVLREIPAPAGTFRLLCAGDRLLALSLFEHAAVVFPLDARGLPVAAGALHVAHDGPIWSAALREDGLLALGGVENRPLDRSGGFFGNIDSYVWVLRVGADSTGALSARPLAEVNVSEHGALTPKWLASDPDSLALTVSGYGGSRLLRLDWPQGWDAPPRVARREVPAGIADGAALDDGRVAFADPLVDAWLLADADTVRAIPVRGTAPARPASERLGEALFFTGLMAPWNASDGARSRFACETCHFEGGVDGRTHYTGRGAIHAATKPLRGLFNDNPYFSRALDPDLTQMVNNEFRVAGAASGASPWFPLDPAPWPWLGALLGDGAPVPPLELRRALMSFLMSNTHPENPIVAGRIVAARAGFTDREAAGARVFRDRCEVCHEARLAANDPATRVPFERWESLVMSPEGPIVWAADRRAMTGVTPYVHEDGPRIPSLRRLVLKRPYFTNGSAATLPQVLAGARFGWETFYHTPPDDDPLAVPLGAEERVALLAFLRLL